MPTSDPQPQAKDSTFSSKKGLNQTQHRPSLGRSADIGMLEPDLLFPVHLRYLEQQSVIISCSKRVWTNSHFHILDNFLKKS